MKHHIIVKWTDEVTDKKAILPAIKEIFDQTLEIEGITSVKLIENVIDRPNRYDLDIVIEMNKEALPVYDDSHPHHLWKDQYSHLIKSKAIFDSEE